MMIRGERQSAWRITLDLVATAAAVTGASILLVSAIGPTREDGRRGIAAPAVPTTPIDIRGMTSKGSKTAGVGIVIFSDFQCPFCKKFSLEIWPTLDAEFVRTEKAMVVFSHLPIPAIHPLAMTAARTAVCADRAGKFWSFHDSLFGFDGPMSSEQISSAASTARLDSNELSRCVQSPTTSARIESDISVARAARVSSTPMVVVGRLRNGVDLIAQRAVRGAASVDRFREAINEILAKAIVDSR